MPEVNDTQAMATPIQARSAILWGQGFSWVVFGLGMLGCLGFLLHERALLTLFPQEPPIAVVTAVSMIFLGLGACLALEDKERGLPGWLNGLKWIFTLLPAVLGLFCMLYYFDLVSFQPVWLKYIGRVGPFFPTFITSSRLVLASFGVAMLCRQKDKNALLDYGICIFGLYIAYTSLFSLGGHILKMPLLYHYMISIPASLSFLFLGMALMWGTLPYNGLLSSIMSEDVTSRRMTIITILLNFGMLVYGFFGIVNNLRFMMPVAVHAEITRLFVSSEISTVLFAILVELIALQAIHYRAEAHRFALQNAKTINALSESEKRFRTLTETSAAMIWQSNASGQAVYWNPKLMEYVGQQAKDLGESWDWTQYARPEVVPTLRQKLKEVGETKQEYNVEFEVWNAESQSYRWVKSAGRPIFSPDGQYTGVVGISIDINDLKVAQENLKKLTDQLVQRNQDLEQFAAFASHDLKAPLRKIALFSNLIASERELLNPENQDALDRITRGVESMQSLIDDLLTWAQAGYVTGNLQPVNLSEVVAQVLQNLKSTLQGKNVEIHVGDLGEVYGDKVQLEQLIQNLLENALKYQPEGQQPKITIEAQAEPTLESKGQQRRLKLLIRDNGLGFKQEYAEKIFLPFERLHGKASPYPGSGLGLAICKRIVERHGGEISAQSNEGQGATFMVTLPAEAPAVQEAARERTPISAAPQSS